MRVSCCWHAMVSLGLDAVQRALPRALVTATHETNRPAASAGRPAPAGSTSSIGLWGRSMGAVTALLYSQRDPSVAGMVLDSPFSRLTALMLELATDQQLRVPKPLVRVALAMLRHSVRRRAGFDIDKVAPVDVVPLCHIPAFFGGWVGAGQWVQRVQSSELGAAGRVGVRGREIACCRSPRAARSLAALPASRSSRQRGHVCGQAPQRAAGCGLCRRQEHRAGGGRPQQRWVRVVALAAAAFLPAFAPCTELAAGPTGSLAAFQHQLRSCVITTFHSVPPTSRRPLRLPARLQSVQTGCPTAPRSSSCRRCRWSYPWTFPPPTRDSAPSTRCPTCEPQKKRGQASD